MHSERKLENLVPAGLTLPCEDLIAESAVQISLANDIRALEPVLAQELLKVFGQRAVCQVMLLSEGIGAWRVKELLEKLVGQRFLHAPFPPSLSFVLGWHSLYTLCSPNAPHRLGHRERFLRDHCVIKADELSALHGNIALIVQHIGLLNRGRCTRLDLVH